MATYLPGAVGPPIYTKTCLYTLTPDRDFVVDRLPDMPGVAVALGAAHGFKFASVLGRVLAELRARRARPHRPPRSPGSGSIGRSSSRTTRPRRGWSDGSGPTVRAIVCVGPGAVPPYRQFGRGGPPSRRRRRMRVSLRGRMARVAAAVGLTAALRTPAATPAAAADPVVLRVGTTQDLDSLNPYQRRCSRLRDVHPQLRHAGRLRAEHRAGRRATPTTGRSRPMARPGRSRSATGMKWSDGSRRPPRCRLDLQTHLDARRRKSGNLGYGYLDPYVTNAAITAVKATDPTTMVVSTSGRTPGSSRPTCQPCRSTSGRRPGRQVGDYANKPPIVGTGQYEVVE